MWCVVVSTYCYERVNSAILPQSTGLQKTLPQPSQVAAILSAVQTLLFAVIQNTILFGSGSADRPMLTQFNHIVSGLQMLLNHDPINENCVSFVALHQNRRIVWAFLGPEPEGRPLFSFFCKGRQSPSCLPCWAMQCWRCNFNDRGKEAESERNRSQSISIVFGFKIICN